MLTNGPVLDWAFDPREALRRWPTRRPVVMLHSGRLNRQWARYSVLAEPVGAYRFDLDEHDRGRSTWIGEEPPPPLAGAWSHRLLPDLRRILMDRRALWLGHLGYDVGRVTEPSLEGTGQAKRDRDWPTVQLHRCPGWYLYDAAGGTWRAGGTWGGGVTGPDLGRLEPNPARFEAGEPAPAMSREAFERIVQRGLDGIAAGDVFQVNLAQRFTTDFTGSPRALFDALADASPAWYGAYVELLRASEEEPHRTIGSTSPELFFQMDEQGLITTRPIKGTLPGAADPAALEASEKDAAELNMIVDLLRNDLGRVCDYGTVRVVQPRAIETHPTVHHGVATVQGRLHPSKTLADLIRAIMPGGSVTGAPKVRAMRIIDELEPVRRGPYCGAIGYILSEQACFNIAIRTLLLEQPVGGPGRVDFSVGGGIVADSTPAAEYQETLAKARAMQHALGMAADSLPGVPR